MEEIRVNTELNDKRAILNVISCVIKNPYLLEEYPLEKEDFEVEAFHEIVFASIYNLWLSGAQIIDGFAIDSFLSNYSVQYKIFTDNNGLNYIENALEISEQANFEYYYSRLKKFSCLRFWEDKGYDITELYNASVITPSEQERETAKLDKISINEMIDYVENLLVNEARIKYGTSTQHRGQLAGLNMKELKEKLKEEPDFGIPMQSPILNTIARGARLKKLYIRSSSSGGGKTRLAVGDICGYSVPYLYNIEEKKWEYKGFSEPTLIISTELEEEEIQTLMMAYVSGVNETHIIEGKYEAGEEERVDQAIEYINSSPLYIEFVPNFNVQEIKHLIKKYKREKNVSYVSFDYVHMSAKLIGEISSVSKGMKLREDMVLFLFIDEMKNLCNTLNIHLDTSTQLNGEYKNVKDKDETLLRGAKSMADRIDMGIISLPPTKAELDNIKPILAKMVGYKIPNLVQHVYKLRRGKLSKIRIWQYADFGTCRSTDLFITNNDFELIPLEITNIERLDEIIENNSIDLEEIELTQEEQKEAVLSMFNW